MDCKAAGVTILSESSLLERHTRCGDSPSRDRRHKLPFLHLRSVVAPRCLSLLCPLCNTDLDSLSHLFRAWSNPQIVPHMQYILEAPLMQERYTVINPSLEHSPYYPKTHIRSNLCKIQRADTLSLSHVKNLQSPSSPFDFFLSYLYMCW